MQSQTQQGNPWLGAVGGAMAANQIYRPQGGGGSSYGGGNPYDGGYGFGTGSGYGFQDYGQVI